MACPEYQDQIIQWQEGSLQAASGRVVEEHLCTCDACRRFYHGLHAVDAAMTDFSSVHGLPAEFKARLMHRIDQETVRLSPEAREARRRALEAEYRAASVSLVRAPWGGYLPRLLNIAGLVAAAAIAWRVLTPSIEATEDLMAWAWAAAAIAVGLRITLGTRAGRRITGPWVTRIGWR